MVTQKGFTIIELMIVISIIAVLAAIALPNYQRYVIQSKRADMMAEMQTIAMRIEGRRLVEGGYTNIPMNKVMLNGSVVGGGMDYPSTNAVYQVTIWDMSNQSRPVRMTGNNLTSAKWQIRATPKTNTIMAQDGELKLDFRSQKCRATSCGQNDEWRVGN